MSLSPRIACIHQGYELYGSDRSFAESVKALRAAFPAAHITVVLPRDGPITGLLRGIATEVTFAPLWVLRRQALLRLATIGAARLIPAAVRAARFFKRYDLVYINTSVIIDHLIAARFFRDKALLHIHEIPEGGGRTILRALVRWSRAEVIFNSKATRSAFALSRDAPTHVIYNGVQGPAKVDPTIYRGARPLRVLMLGRINRVKGQEVLLDALASLPADLLARFEVRIVGSAFESVVRERALADRIAVLNLSSSVSAEPFLPDPSPLYRWADIVAVPSRRPESLGRVAIEAMAFGRPVLASAIGGLVEVVEDGRTGWLVPPGDAAALASQLRAIVDKPEPWAGFGTAGLQRYQTLFGEAAAADAIAGVAHAKLSRSKVTLPSSLLPASSDTL